jgi:serine/threonine protein kinase
MQASDPNLAAGVYEGALVAGKYRIERVLGVGGMGVVVAARHLQLDTKVAIKFLLPSMLGNEEAVSRFAREARAAVKITSEHVARVFDVGTLESGAPYMVMEFLEGGDLAAWLQQRGPLPVEQAVEFVLQACVAVADAHGLGIVHRDLKPANLFCVLRSDGQFLIKVLDFGISKLTDPGASGAGMSVTQTSAVMGSPLYMSPEQMQSPKDVDSSTDIWALGVVLFELLTGTVPFGGETFGEIAVKVATLPPPPMGQFRPDVPAALEAAIRKCLRPNRNERHRNVAELAVALLPFAPKRSRASVERISAILHAAGLSSATGAEVQPLPAIDTPPLRSETISAVGGTAPSMAPRGRGAVAGVFGALAVLAAIAAAVVLRPTGGDRGAQGDVAPSAASSQRALLGGAAPKTPGTSETQAPAASVGPDVLAAHGPAMAASAPGAPAPAASEEPSKSLAAKSKRGAVASGHATPEGPAATPVVATTGQPEVDPLGRLKLKL